jgi:hypothetical protein
MLLLYNIVLSIFSTLPHDETNCSSMLFPNIAEPGRSVWDAVSRRTFEIHVDALSHARSVPEACILFEKDWPEQRREDALPFGIELTGVKVALVPEA